MTFNKICLLTHPDKTDDKFKNYLFIKTMNAYLEKKIYKLILIAKILNININKYFSQISDKILMNEIFSLNEETNRMRTFL